MNDIYSIAFLGFLIVVILIGGGIQAYDRYLIKKANKARRKVC